MALLIILVIALFLASSIGAADRIRIAVSNPNMPNLTATMAQKKGFFKEANLDAEIIRMNPNVAITALATGDIDYCQLFGAVVGGAPQLLPQPLPRNQLNGLSHEKHEPQRRGCGTQLLYVEACIHVTGCPVMG